MNFPKEIVYCPKCGREVAEHPLHKEDEPVEHDNFWYHNACLADDLIEAAIMTEKENDHK